MQYIQLADAYTACKHRRLRFGSIFAFLEVRFRRQTLQAAGQAFFKQLAPVSVVHSAYMSRRMRFGQLFLLCFKTGLGGRSVKAKWRSSFMEDSLSSGMTPVIELPR